MSKRFLKLWGKIKKSYAQTGSLHSFLAFIYLSLYYNSRFRKQKQYFLLDLYYRLFDLSRVNDLNSIKMIRAVERKRHPDTRRQGDKVNAAEFAGKMYEIYRQDNDALTWQDKIDIVHHLANTADVGLLKRIYADREYFEGIPGLRHYANGFLRFAAGEDGWAESFQNCAREYLDYDPNGNALPKYVEFTSNFFDKEEIKELREKVKLLQVKHEVAAAKETVVLVSCERDYFKAFANFFMHNFRKSNRHRVVFLVVIGPDAETEEIDKLFKGIKPLGNVELMYYRTNNNIALMSSLARFLYCEAIMHKFGSDVLIMDIDIYSVMNLDEILRNIKEPLAFMCYSERVVPWVKMNAGFSLFKLSPVAINYLRLVGAYLEYGLHHGGRWSLDQTALYMTRLFYEKKIAQPIIHEFGTDVKTYIFRPLPKKLTALKGKHKAGKRKIKSMIENDQSI